MVLNLGVVTPKGVNFFFFFFFFGGGGGGRDKIGFTNLFIIIFTHCYADNMIDLDMITVYEVRVSTCIGFRMTLSAAVIYINISNPILFLGGGGSGKRLRTMHCSTV